MSYFDKKFGEIFPVRNGVATGSANERQMLDAIGGADSFRTRIQTNPDGSQTLCRTKNGMPQFSTSSVPSKGTEVFMDSGGIDPIAVAPLDPHRLDDGILHYGLIQKAYVLLKRLLGKINTSTLESRDPPLDLTPAKSFSVSLSALGVRDPDLLDLLYVKKVASARVPASMFCGKARLYAQAQYGAPAAQWGWLANLAGIPALTHGNGTSLNTNSGVFIDADSTHWLLSMDNLGVKITRLLRDARVTPLVKKLNDPLFAEDKDKIETYILAYSTPDPSMSFWIAVPGTPACDMFGYGWKFNWDGDRCDIVYTKIVSTGGATTKYVSTHYRVSFSRDAGIGIGAGTSDPAIEKTRWRAMLSTVESAEWKSDKWGQVITSPLWSEGVLEVFGDILGTRFGDAPVYCFYRRNELEVVRFKISGGAALVQYKRVSSPVAWIGQHDWSVDNVTATQLHGSLGLAGADGQIRTRTSTPYTAGFYSPSANAVLTTQGYTYTRESLDTKTEGAVLTWYGVGAPWGTTAAYEVDATLVDSLARTLSDGVPYYEGGSSTMTPVGQPYGGLVWSRDVAMTFTRGSYTGENIEQSDILMVVPFGDAEAVYLHAVRNTTTSENGNKGTSVQGVGGAGGYYMTEYQWTNGTTSRTWKVYFASGDVYLPAVSYTVPDNTPAVTTHAVECSSLITSAGAQVFTPPDSLSPFFAGEPVETVSQTYNTKTSAVEKAVIGHGTAPPASFTDTEKLATFIGWA